MPLSWVAMRTVVPVRLIRSSSRMIPAVVDGIQVAGRLVGEEDQGPVDERPGDGDPLLLAAGQLVRAGWTASCRVRPGPGSGAPATAPHGGAGRSPPGRKPRSRRRTWSGASGSPGRRSRCCGAGRAPSRTRAPDLLARHPDPASLGLLLFGDQAEEGRLARNRRPDQEDELAFLDVDVDVSQGDSGPLVGLGDVLELDHQQEYETAGGSIRPRPVIPDDFSGPGAGPGVRPGSGRLRNRRSAGQPARRQRR